VQAPGGVEIQAEYPVCMARPGGTLLAGFIDLLAVQDGEVVVLDFKDRRAAAGHYDRGVSGVRAAARGLRRGAADERAAGRAQGACRARLHGERRACCGGSDTQHAVGRDRHVMLPALGARQAHVTTGLACDPIAQSLEGFGEIGARQVPRELHAEMTSSRTKWSRMTLGA